MLQYEPHQKLQYITCSYTDVDVDIHLRSRRWIEGDEDEEGHWSDWSEWKHSRVYSMSLDGVSSKADLDTKIDNYLDSINPSTSTYEVEYPTICLLISTLFSLTPLPGTPPLSQMQRMSRSMPADTATLTLI